MPALDVHLDTRAESICIYGGICSGNEQYNEQFVEQVAAMETRAKKLGMGGKLHYIFPSNGGLNPADTVKAKALGIDQQMAADIHVSELSISTFYKTIAFA